ncbi:MAG TPA: thiolase family protein [Acidimicrobiales bacterium]|jgi:acetyl-CoA acetyltransferase|nr:thiolase family protein [Acidimicrobiales bacterium]
MKRYPAKDQVAVVGVGSTGFRRDAAGRTSASLAVEASVAAIRDAGLGRDDVDALIVAAEPGAPTTHQLAGLLGIPTVLYHGRPSPVAGFAFMDAVNAVYAGSCDTVLVCFAMMRSPGSSQSSAKDPFRRHLGHGTPGYPENANMAAAYAAWASRYIHEYDARREDFGLVAINERTNAAQNPLAVMRAPLTMEDYLAARMIREPLCLFDMDVPVDGADAFVLTSTERARSLGHAPVMIHAATAGLVGTGDEDQLPNLRRHGQHVVIERLKQMSDIWLDDVDVYLPYDGFTNITLAWIENTGWCEPGQAGRFLAANWDKERGRVLIDGRIPMNPHGGSLSEGATRGSGHLREAVVQLRGEAGERQVPGARTALVTPGGFFFNSQRLILQAATRG